MLKPVWIVVFLGLEADDAFERLPATIRFCEEGIRLALTRFQKAAKSLGGTIELVSGAAECADHLAIKVAESLGLAVHLILPLPIGEFAVDFRDRPAIWDNALAVISKAGGLVDRDESFTSELCALGERKANRLEITSQWFLALQTPTSIRRAVFLTEEILLNELIEWHAASKNIGK